MVLVARIVDFKSHFPGGEPDEVPVVVNFIGKGFANLKGGIVGVTRVKRFLVVGFFSKKGGCAVEKQTREPRTRNQNNNHLFFIFIT